MVPRLYSSTRDLRVPLRSDAHLSRYIQPRGPHFPP